MSKKLVIIGAEKMPPPPFIRFGCLQRDADGRWFCPIYMDGDCVGKSYVKHNPWVYEGTI